MLTWQPGSCRIGIANGVATVGTANSGDTNPRCFWWACVVLEWVNVPTGSRTDSKIAQRQGSSPPKPLGVFLLCHARSRTVRGSNAPNPAADKKRVQDGGNGFPNPVQIRKACGGREPSSRGEMVSNPFHAKVGIFPGEAILLSYPLGVGGRLGEIY